MRSIANQLTDLKYSLQDLESAVQQPRDERLGIEQVIEEFPHVLTTFSEVLNDLLQSHGITVSHPHEAFAEAHKRGWLKGDLSLWLHLVSDFQQLKEEEPHGAKARSVAQDVRACSCMFWETYELLTARFRWQTQIQPAARVAAPSVTRSYVTQSM